MRFIKAKQLIEWLMDFGFLNYVFGNDVHMEIIRRSKPIFSFLAEQKQIEIEEIDKIWEFQINKHETIVQAVYDVIVGITETIGREMIDYIYAKISSIPVE